MDVELLFVVGVIILSGLAVVVFLLKFPSEQGFSMSASSRARMARIVAAQRDLKGENAGRQMQNPSLQLTDEEKVERLNTSRLTLEKKLRFAQWKIPPLAFRVLEIVISIVAFSLVSIKCNTLMSLMALCAGPVFMRWLIGSFIEHRFKSFDADYPAFLMSVVSMLKTGMNTITALESAAQGLEQGSLVREEVDLMLERLRYGVSEEKSIGAFGEDIFHPEIELLVQALLLSRRVGGNLADTLDRLAKQVRKRQYFRESANAAVGMQRGSIVFILCIMVGLMIYLYFVYPDVITKSIIDPFGWQVWQFSFAIILLGIFWVRQVTKIRV